MDALSSFDTALVCFLNEILLNNIEKHTTSIVLPRRRIRKNKRMLKFSELKDGKLLWTAFKWLINTSLRNVNLDVAFDIEENHIRNNTPRNNNNNNVFQNDENVNYNNNTKNHDNYSTTTSSLNSMFNTIKETFISPSSWNNIRNEIVDIYYEFPSVIKDYDNGNIDFKIRLVLELMVSIAVHSDNNEFYVKKIMKLRQDMQHMLMIAIQRQYVPAILESQTLSPVKIMPSPTTLSKNRKKNKNKNDEEELTPDPEDFILRSSTTIDNSKNINHVVDPFHKNLKQSTSLSHTSNNANVKKEDTSSSVIQRSNVSIETQQEEDSIIKRKEEKNNDFDTIINTTTMTPQKFFKTPFGKNSNSASKRKKKNNYNMDERNNNNNNDSDVISSSPSIIANRRNATPSSNLLHKVSTQKKEIEHLTKELKQAKEKISTLNRQKNNRHVVQEEMAIIIEDQNAEITKLKETTQVVDDLKIRNATLSEQLEELENSDILCKEALNKVEKAQVTLLRMAKENKTLKSKLLEQKDIEIDRKEFEKLLNEKKVFEDNKEYYKSQFNAKKIKCDQLEWQLAEEKQYLKNEKTKRHNEMKIYEEKEKLAKENIKVLERSVDQLQFELQSEKDDMLYKLEKIRKDHKAAILSYEIAFHQKLAEVCRQRDEYAEVADHLREKIKKQNVVGKEEEEDDEGYYLKKDDGI